MAGRPPQGPKDPAQAQALMDQPVDYPWAQRLNRWAQLVNPWLEP
jgi:hypothetical protein